MVRVKVAVSRQFFGWLTGLSDAVKIVGPKETAEEYRSYLEEILTNYS